MFAKEVLSVFSRVLFCLVSLFSVISFSSFTWTLSSLSSLSFSLGLSGSFTSLRFWELSVFVEECSAEKGDGIEEERFGSDGEREGSEGREGREKSNSDSDVCRTDEERGEGERAGEKISLFSMVCSLAFPPFKSSFIHELHRTPPHPGGGSIDPLPPPSPPIINSAPTAPAPAPSSTTLSPSPSFAQPIHRMLSVTQSNESDSLTDSEEEREGVGEGGEGDRENVFGVDKEERRERSIHGEEEEALEEEEVCRGK